MKAREARKLLRAAEHHERKAYIQKIDRAFNRLSAECSNKVLKAVTQAPDWRVRPEPEVSVNRENPKYRKVCNEANRQIHAVQKRKGSSIPLI